MNFASLTESPRLWPAGKSHRRVTWLELFFDLIFVAAVAQVGKPLVQDYTLHGVLRYTFLFVLIWWAWSGHTLYTTRFEHDDGVQRALTLVQCFIAAVMAANASEALESRSSAGFGAAYAGMRIILVVQYLRARSVPETRPLTTRYAAGFGIAALLWLGSAFLDVPERYWVWGLALAIDFATPWLAASHSLRFPPDATHFPERFGLFTIILLGEFVAAVMRGIESQEDWTFGAAGTAFSAMAFAFLLRWWYFDVARSAEERHGRSRREAAWFQVWHYAHLPMFLGIAIAGAGFEKAISLRETERLDFAANAVVCVAVAVLMGALVAIGAASQRGRHMARNCALVVPCLALAASAGCWHRVAFALTLVTACWALAASVKRHSLAEAV